MTTVMLQGSITFEPKERDRFLAANADHVRQSETGRPKPLSQKITLFEVTGARNLLDV
jgi:hypothetical protein